jgi:hypothetical protein
MMRKIQSSIWLVSFAILSLSAAGFLFPSPARSEPADPGNTEAAKLAAGATFEQAQAVFNARCIACHSCNNAPCQLKLTSFEGIQRGASKSEAIQPSRLKSIPPTRLGIDAHTVEDWSRKGFSRVTGENGGLIASLLNQNSARSPADPVTGTHSCPANIQEAEKFKLAHPDRLMPYGLPPLTQQERDILTDWAGAGAKPGAAKPEEALPAGQEAAKQSWEAFLNRPDPEHRLTARYIYEHLFLASLQFAENSRQFHRIIRSRTPCDQPLDEIATRRPSDDPETAFHYCLKPFPETIVEKTLLPYLLDESKLQKTEGLFFDPRQPWKVRTLPQYQSFETTNPFVVFQDIPVNARYRFLLEDAHYHVATFIKGPVCYGRGAVSSIDEHFFVFFMSPDSELMAIDREFAKDSESLLVLPYMDGSDAPLFESRPLDELWQSLIHRQAFTEKYVAARNAFVSLKNKRRAARFKNGYGLPDLWNGDGGNPNAVLTVFRHFDHSYALQGFRGGEATSYFVLDYGLLERLVYNLVTGYDVFGNVSHQLHTRLYMDMLRREAEDNFLLFLPPSERNRLRSRWYRGAIAKLGQMSFAGPDIRQFPTAVAYKTKADLDKELIAKIAGEYLNAKVRGRYDGTPHSEYAALEPMAQWPAKEAPFVRMFPDTSLILIKSGGQIKKVATVIRNRAHNVMGRFMLEKTARVPQQDRLAIVDGLATSFPNLFFEVDEGDLPQFLNELKAVTGRASARSFLERRAILRTNPGFWTVSDNLHARLRELDPGGFGQLDYTRYGVWSERGDWSE